MLCGCAGNPFDAEYKGADSGILIYSAGYVGVPVPVNFYYRRKGAPPQWGAADGGRIHYNASLLLRTPLDYEGHESGAVRIAHLQPGEYEIYTWETIANSPLALGVERSAVPFSLPFTITAGRATYIGSYEGIPMGNVGLLPSFYYAITDRHERDLAVAHKKYPNLPPVNFQVPDVSHSGNGTLLSVVP